MCHNCEGEIDLDVIVCPFCAADLREARRESSPAVQPARPMQAKQMSQGLYPPPYGEREEPEIAPIAAVHAETEEVPAEESLSRFLSPIVLLTLGAQLFFLGLLLFVFSHKGTLILKWDARLWFLYIFASVPLGLFGYRALAKL